MSAVAIASPSPHPARVRVALSLTWLLARRGGFRSAVLLLPITAFAAMTTLLLTVLAGGLSFFRWQDELAGFYQGLAGLALVLLLVPLTSLGAAAARLSARRRDDRLATLRLIGASTWTVARMTIIESMAVAFLGACLGVVGYLMVGPAVSLIHFRGQAIGADFWLSAWVVALVVAAVCVLAAASALLGLRQVSMSPLGVRQRSNVPRLGWLRLAVGLLVLVAAVVAVNVAYVEVAVAIIAILAAFAGGLAVLNLIGPWVIGVIARVSLRRAATPDRLLAARSIEAAPKAVWRQINGVVLTCFVAVVAGTGAALMSNIGSDPGSAEDAMLAADIQTGVLITIVASFLMVATSAGVTQAAEVLDRAELYRSLDKLGVPLATMVRAQVRTVMVPLVTVAAIAVVVSGMLVLPLAGVAMLTAPLSVAVIIASLILGLTLVRLGVGAAKPVLRSILRS